MAKAKPFEIKRGDLAGFDIAAIKLPDGKYRIHNFLGSGEILDEMPREIDFMGITYGLEYIDEGAPQAEGIWVNAVYA